MMIAQECGLKAHEFIHTFGDVHIYSNHIEGAKKQIARSPKTIPQMHLNPEVKSVFEFTYEDFKLEGYDPEPHIKFEIAV